MYAYMMAGGNQMSIIAEMLASTINQNVGKWHLSTSISEIERRVVKWGADMIGYNNNVDALEFEIQNDLNKGFEPFFIIGTAGTVNTGAIDDLNILANLAKKYDCWFHVEGAYGGLAACLDSIKQEYAGIERADSVAMNFHKWLYPAF